MNLKVLIYLIVIVAISYPIYKYWSKNKERRRISRLFIKSKIDIIREANRNFSNALDYNSGYFSNHQLTVWQSTYLDLYKELKNSGYDHIGLDSTDTLEIVEFISYYENGKSQRNKRNQSFIESESKSYSEFFNNIEGRRLDNQQKTAIITDEDNNLVIAGAGSGKTTTIVGKVKYVIDRYHTDPDNILLISFTNKSASELSGRIKESNVKARTFHKLGMDIITAIEGKKPTIYDDNQFNEFLSRSFKELAKDNGYLQITTDYFIEYLKPIKSQFDYDSHGEYIQYLKDYNIKTYKLIETYGRDRITLNREVVKSIEECKIANFLLFNGVDYKYEEVYEYETADMLFSQYKPDFTITQGDKKVYLEHFAVSQDESVPSYFAEIGESPEMATKRYWEGIKWKRELHNSKGTTLIETYSYEMHSGVLYNNLAERLKESGIVLISKTPSEKWDIITKAAADEVDSITTLFQTFITLMKSNNYSISDLRTKNSNNPDPFIKERNELFLRIIEPLYIRYQRHLLDLGEIDFSDMINKATAYIKCGRHTKSFEYIIIDEFQDISIGRYHLVQAIKTVNPACKLFCVGDDWQSIFRFTGSDISLFSNYEKYFGFTVRSKIETTYRFSNPLLQLSSSFIMKNPSQVVKELRSPDVAKLTKYQIIYSVSDNNKDDTMAFKKILDGLMETYPNIKSKKIYLLSRYNFDIKRIGHNSGLFTIKENRDLNNIRYSSRDLAGKPIVIDIEHFTIHKAKGAEADIVIILNCNAGKYGFPAEMADDQVLNLLLSEADQFEDGEERRLFYVAMTRARECVYFIADSYYKSKFIKELEATNVNLLFMKCPVCQTGDLVIRTGKKGEFLGCSNYLYGCGHTEPSRR